AGGRIRDQILARQAALVEELSRVDGQVDLLVRNPGGAGTRSAIGPPNPPGPIGAPVDDR
ncbi:MAG: hypothetical protein ACXW1S_07100, partial [Acidimicrobiia bacterium]